MKKRDQLLQIGLLICLTVGMLLTAQPAGAANLQVCPQLFCVYHSITAAVAAAHPGDTIKVGKGIYNERDIVIGVNLTITGVGSGLVSVNGGENGRIFYVDSGVTAAISGMTITEGNAQNEAEALGGGIFNAGNLTLNDLVITNNAAPGNDGNQGGGIYSTGNLTMTNSQLTWNRAGFGGGGLAIRNNFGTSEYTTTTQLTNVLIQNNYISGDNAPAPDNAGGGGIYAWNYLQPINPPFYVMNVNLNQVTIDNNTGVGTGNGVGGGIQAGDANLTITNSTISNNTADAGGGIFSEGAPTLNMTNDTLAGNVAQAGDGGGMDVYDNLDELTNVTVSGNDAEKGGGIENFSGIGSVYLADTLIAGNSATVSDPDCYETFVSEDNNLVGDTTGCTLTGTTTHDITGVAPMLGSLANNGGPTKTMALLPASPAIDAGNNSTCASTDQRGVARPVGAFCDIGAYEFQPNSTTKIIFAVPNPSKIGQNVTVLVFVSGGTGTPTGTVAITGTDANCTITLSGGAGACGVNFSSSGPKTVVAWYSGDAKHNKSSGALAHLVYYQRAFYSIGAQDGWVLQASKGSRLGGSLDASSPTFQLGDDALNRQYRGFLSFDTSVLPRNAIIGGAELMIKQDGSPTGLNPFTSLGRLDADIKDGFFGLSPALELLDFNALPSAYRVGVFDPTPLGGWYSAPLDLKGRSLIDRGGLTQFRLYFSKPTNNNNQADFMQFFSGNYDGDLGRPLLIIYYTLTRLG
ncbi:MAG: choice-of-anchor Q domain-containing protein [Anaerolineales bacterium]